ncbi:MFS transporter [Nesterenkonia ebinurensis]|uniref:MFS transporter n=1 Tax=Nesterenkonia ebinurensis TaxID=2608252 RepID=UPI00168B65DD|nr:MFS transporter [Nesterenkonia ebinurensis]
MTSLPVQRRALMASNGSAAAHTSALDVATDVLFVTILGAAAYQMGLINALGSLSFLLLAVPIGILIDRSHPLLILRLAQMVLLVLVSALLALHLIGVLTIWLGMVLVTLIGVCTTALSASKETLAPRLIEYDADRTSYVSRFVSRLTSTDETVRIIAPAASGLVITAWGASALIGISIALLGIALLSLTPIRRTALPAAEASTDDDAGSAAPAPKTAFWKTVTAGFTELTKLRQLLAITLLVTATNAAISFGTAVEVIFLLEVLGLDPALFGAALSAGAVGGLLGALVGPRLLPRFTAPQIVVAGTLGQVVASSFYIVAAFTTLPVAVALVFAHSVLWGFAVVAASVANMGWAASIMPESHFGRITTARRTLTMGVVPVAGLFGGVSGSVLGIVPTLAIWPCITASALVIYALVSRMRSRSASR